MLVLRRKRGEKLILTGRIEITVLAIEGERVKLGISAPPDVAIVREEVLRRASSPSPSRRTTRKEGDNQQM